MRTSSLLFRCPRCFGQCDGFETGCIFAAKRQLTVLPLARCLSIPSLVPPFWAHNSTERSGGTDCRKDPFVSRDSDRRKLLEISNVSRLLSKNTYCLAQQSPSPQGISGRNSSRRSVLLVSRSDLARDRMYFAGYLLR